jgi:hypothetical protein
MSSKRLACLLLGAWIAASLFMSWIATENFRSVDRMLHDPTAGAIAQMKQFGYDSVRQLLRYQVGELNRFYFYHWEMAQMAIGLLLFSILLFGTDAGKYTLALPLLMLLLVALAHWAITPNVASMGKSLDFLPASEHLREEVRFRTFHQAYGGVEILKLILGIVLAGLLAVHRGTRRKLRKKVDAVDYPDHRHVNG